MAVKYRVKQQRPTAYRHSATAWLLYGFSLPFLFAALSHLLAGNSLPFVLTIAVFGGIVLSATLIGRGIKNRREFEQQQYATDTPFPLIFLGSLILAASVFAGSWLVAGDGLFSALGYAAAALLGVWLWYGLDAVKARSLASQEPQVQAVLAESERRIRAIEKARNAITQPELAQRLQRITGKAREVLAVLAENPEKVTQSRRFLHTYLESTENIVGKYAKTHTKVNDETLEKNFREVLINIEDTFNRQYEKLLSSDVFDLDVDIEVLNTLMKKQGLG
jgi:hypothetical protein